METWLKLFFYTFINQSRSCHNPATEACATSTSIYSIVLIALLMAVTCTATVFSISIAYSCIREGMPLTEAVSGLKVYVNSFASGVGVISFIFLIFGLDAISTSMLTVVVPNIFMLFYAISSKPVNVRPKVEKTIETITPNELAEQTDKILQQEPVSVNAGLRFWASSIDFFFIWICGPAMVPPIILISKFSFSLTTNSPIELFFILISPLLVVVPYSILCECSSLQGNLGYKAMNLIVIDRQHRRISFKSAWIRLVWSATRIYFYVALFISAISIFFNDAGARVVSFTLLTGFLGICDLGSDYKNTADHAQRRVLDRRSDTYVVRIDYLLSKVPVETDTLRS